MLRVFASATLLALILILCSPPPADADILIGKKNGDLVECKALRVEQAKDQFGNKYQVYVVKLEDGTEKKYRVKDYALLRRKPSWVRRAEEKEWYAKESPKVKDTWRDHERFARRLKSPSKKYLDDEMYIHYKKDYDLRKPDIKDTQKDHQLMAKTCER